MAKNGKSGTLITLRQLAAWLDGAQPGARLVYFHGWNASEGDAAVNEYLRTEAARGMLFLVQDPRGADTAGRPHVAIRSSRVAGVVPVKPKSMAAQARAEGARAFRSSGR